MFPGFPIVVKSIIKALLPVPKTSAFTAVAIASKAANARMSISSLAGGGEARSAGAGLEGSGRGKLRSARIGGTIFITMKSHHHGAKSNHIRYSCSPTKTDQPSRIAPLCRLPAPINPRNSRRSRAWSSRSRPPPAEPYQWRGFAQRRTAYIRTGRRLSLAMRRAS